MNSNDNISIVLQILSAGVIAALVTGVFSLVIAVKNNKRLIELENSKQKFTLTQKRFESLREAYSELLSTLPQEKTLGNFIINLPSREGFEENGLSDAYQIADSNIGKLYRHFQKYCFLLSNDEQKKVNDLIEKIDEITKRIICIRSGIQVYDIKQDGTTEAAECIHKNIMEKIVRVTEFEELYYELYKNNLSALSNGCETKACFAWRISCILSCDAKDALV